MRVRMEGREIEDGRKGREGRVRMEGKVGVKQSRIGRQNLF